MQKNVYLTPSQQEVFNSISSLHIIDTDLIQGIFPDIHPLSLNRVLSNLSKKGYLHRVKRGIYTVSIAPDTHPDIYDPFSLALSVCPGYLGFSSALRIYDLISYEPFTIFVVTRKKSYERSIREYTIRCVSMGKRAYGMRYYKNRYISTLEKTFYDCFYKPQYAGGYCVITEALNLVESFNWDAFCGFFSNESGSFCQRTGYILDMFNQRTGKVPEGVISLFKGQIKNNSRLIVSGPGSGRYIRSWMLIDNLGEENIFSWWSQ